MKCPNCGLVKPKVIPNVIGYGYLPFRFPFIGFGKVNFERKEVNTSLNAKMRFYIRCLILKK